jgi:hypothetical protein
MHGFDFSDDVIEIHIHNTHKKVSI